MVSGTATDPLEFALDLLETVRDSGLTLVPARPSATMLDAASQAAGITPAQALAAFQAMIAAAEEPSFDPPGVTGAGHC